jgi:serine/threonine-protein kinase
MQALSARALSCSRSLTDTQNMVNGRYELVERTAEGGMAAVWRANVVGAAGFRRPVAIKRILPGQNDDLFAKMFVEEARIGSQLQHPNIVQVFDFGHDDMGMYLVMEWVEGVDLNEYMKAHREAERPIPWPIVTSIGIDALRGLRAAHERVDADGRLSPVIHRDVTPANILLDISGMARLTDFGVSRAMDRASWTSPDIVKGKLAYMAPEIFADKPASARSDLFSLGVALWEALAGRRLYSGTDVEVFLAAREAEIPSLTRFRDDLPRELVGAVERALHRQPEHRFPSALEMLRELSLAMRRSTLFVEESLAQSVAEVRRGLRRQPPAGPRSGQRTVPACPPPDPTEQVFYLTRRKKTRLKRSR